MTPISAKPAEAKVMVSNLPLLFARGSPTSLESMCLEELQVFLRFVLKCEQNLAIVNLDQLEQPQWWPADVDWSESFLQKKEQRGKMSIILRTAIKACYTYHDCMYLLEFCRKLITFTGGIENLQVIDNRDGTRSLLNRINKKLLVTFRAENQDYDKQYFEHRNNSKTTRGPTQPTQPGTSKKQPADSKLRQLLVSPKSDNTSDPSLTKCVELYLCDTCDKDFDSLSNLLTHEKTCGKSVPPPTVHVKGAQDAFLKNVNLFKRGQSMPTPRKIKESERPRAANYEKFMEIDVTSPLGRYIVSSSGLTITQMNPASRGYKSIEEYNQEVEARCPGTCKSLKNSNANMEIKGKWNISYKCSKKKANLWTHTYCFTAAEMEAKMRVMKAGLTPKSLRLYRRCKNKKMGVDIKKVRKDAVAAVLARYAEMDRLDKLDQLKAEQEFKLRNNLVKSSTVDTMDQVDDKVIDELLEDGSDHENEVKILPNIKHSDNGHVESSKNSFMNFKNVGFRTNLDNIESFTHENTPFVSSSFIVQDEAYSSNEHESSVIRKPQLKISVPRPLPELQRIGFLKSVHQNGAVTTQSGKAKAIARPEIEVECVDLCSSDED